jgi:putative restriction endonuclease
VGVTDDEWYRFLAARPEVTEVNFWRPSSARHFRVLTPGEPFFFKTHAPHNRVVGGGFHSGFAPLPVSEAWELYGEGNGVANLEEMRAQIGKYRQQPIAADEDPVIGCVLLRDTRFFTAADEAGPPPDFASNIVQGKSYDLAAHPQARYFEELVFQLLGHRVEVDFSQPWHRPGPVFGDPRMTPRRLGQQAFKAVLLGAYDHRCAITGSRIRPALQAAHIRPVTKGGEHRLDNGLLLRSDVHAMFDHGYLGVDPEYRLMVSSRLRADFGGGEEFYARAGEPITMPERRTDRPSREFLGWHTEKVFKAS